MLLDVGHGSVRDGLSDGQYWCPPGSEGAAQRQEFCLVSHALDEFHIREGRDRKGWKKPQGR